MTSALFVSHTGEKGGAELFLADIVKAGPRSWRACFLRRTRMRRSGIGRRAQKSPMGKPPACAASAQRALNQ